MARLLNPRSSEPDPRTEAEEQRFVNLIDQYNAASSEEERQQAERMILELVADNFDRHLRPLVGKVLGQRANNDRVDCSARYTQVVNDFFLKVMQQRSAAFWKADNLRNVRKWASVVITNQFRDYLNRKKRGTLADDETLAALVEQKADEFERRYCVPYERALDQIEQWAESSDERSRTMASVLRWWAVDGLPAREIAELLGTTPKAVEHIRQRAIHKLRELA